MIRILYINRRIINLIVVYLGQHMLKNYSFEIEIISEKVGEEAAIQRMQSHFCLNINKNLVNQWDSLLTVHSLKYG